MSKKKKKNTYFSKMAMKLMAVNVFKMYSVFLRNQFKFLSDVYLFICFYQLYFKVSPGFKKDRVLLVGKGQPFDF